MVWTIKFLRNIVLRVSKLISYQYLQNVHPPHEQVELLYHLVSYFREFIPNRSLVEDTKKDERFSRIWTSKIDWTSSGPDLKVRFKRFRQKNEMLFDGPLKQRTEKQKCKYLLLWTGDYALDLFNTWTLSEEEKNKLAEYWNLFEEHVKPQSNHILNRFYLRSLKQNNRPLDEFLTEARLLIKNSGFPAELHDELLSDSLVFGAHSDALRKKCTAERWFIHCFISFLYSH